MPHIGKCLCGKTTVEVGSTHEEQIVCHCKDCRQTSGSAFSTNILVLKTEVKISGEPKEYTIKAASGNPVTRIFCGGCGSALAHKSVVFGDKMAVQTGNFEDFATIPINTELFVKDRWTGLDAIKGAAQVQAMP